MLRLGCCLPPHQNFWLRACTGHVQLDFNSDGEVAIRSNTWTKRCRGLACTNVKLRFQGVCVVGCWPQTIELVWLPYSSFYADLQGRARSLREKYGFAQADSGIKFSTGTAKELQRFEGWVYNKAANKAASSSPQNEQSRLTFDLQQRLPKWCIYSSASSSTARFRQLTQNLC